MVKDVQELIDLQPKITFLFGEEEFLIDEAFETVVNAFKQTDDDSLNTDIFDADSSIDLNYVIDVCRTFPFIGERRIVAIRNFEKLFSSSRTKKIDEKNPLVRYLQAPSESTKLIISAQLDGFNGLTTDYLSPKNRAKAEKKIASAKFPYNILLEKAEWLEFSKVYDNQLSTWVNSRAKLMGKQFQADALELLITHTNPNLRELSNEIEKLVLFCNSKSEIGLDDVSIVTGVSKQYNIFELQKAVGRKDLKESFLILENMLGSDKQEILIITMISRFFTILWLLLEESSKSQDKYVLSSKIGVNPFFLPDYTSALKKYSDKEIANAFFYLHDADKELKSSTTNSLYIMQKMLIGLMQQ